MRSWKTLDLGDAGPPRGGRSLPSMTYIAITIAIAQGLALLLGLAALRAAGRADRALERGQPEAPVA